MGGPGVETVDSLHKRGNAAVARGDHREALGLYAAALAKLERTGGGYGSEAERERVAVLRSNRALCCLSLDRPEPELALAEAEKSEELRPDWPKASFRKASALEALGRLGEARLALCHAKRMAPKDGEICSALSRLRRRIFGDGGAAARVGTALDTLEDFSVSPASTKAAAEELKELLMTGAEAELDRADALRAFVEGKGADTLFRRQNAMGEHWKEECKNGTMGLLSLVASAAPQLEQELVALNQKAETQQRGTACADGAPGCKEPRKTGPPPPPRPRGAKREGGRRAGARPLSDAFDGLASSDEAMATAQPGGQAEEPTTQVDAEPRGPKGPKSQRLAKASARPAVARGEARACEGSQWQALVLAALPGPEALLRFGAAAAVSRAWAQAARSCGRLPLWGAWAEGRWPGASECLAASERGVLRALLSEFGGAPREASGSPEARLSAWCFFVDVRREERTLWRGALSASGHALAPALEGVATATLFERSDIVTPGDRRRLGAAGVAAALGAGPAPDHSARVVAVHSASGRAFPIEAGLALGSRRQLQEAIPAPPATLRCVVGFGARSLACLPKAGLMVPQGSIEISLGLAFLGPDGLWLPGVGAGRVMLAALLEASSAWGFLEASK